MLPAFLMAQAPIVWNNSVKKVDANTYEIHLKAIIDSPWHLYSQKTPSGGPLPTTIHFNKNPVTALIGIVVEKGTLIKNHEKVFGIEVMYFNREVEFVQTIKVNGKIHTSVGGTIKYMACNDNQCLPPDEFKFLLPLQ